jgi:hypothetical protein
MPSAPQHPPAPPATRMPARRVSKARASPIHGWAVTKTMQVDAAGAIKLSRRYGERLVCVRYRISPDGLTRLTTIELEFDRVPVQKKSNPMVAVKIYPSETRLIAKATARGARYNAKTRLWRMRRNDVLTLGLTARIARVEHEI